MNRYMIIDFKTLELLWVNEIKILDSEQGGSVTCAGVEDFIEEINRFAEETELHAVAIEEFVQKIDNIDDREEN